MRTRISEKTALVVVDVQKDFCPGGALAVPEGDRVVPALNEYVKMFRAANAPIIFTRDWHPSDHASFKSQGGPWPIHCLQNSDGAKFHPSLVVPPEAEVVSKADKKDEAYSFFQGTSIADTLRRRGIKTLFIGGLATDYCVKETVLDGLKEGFEVYYLDDASRGVNVKAADSVKAVEIMLAKGAKKIVKDDVQ
jgi:nicotinamidase/pyrazinamidase